MPLTRLQSGAACLSATQRPRLAPPPQAFASAAGGEGGEAALGADDAAGSSALSSSGGAAAAAGSTSRAGSKGWQRRWTMVAMCFVAFMVGGLF